MKQFDTFQDAFDYCRKQDCPVVVYVEGDSWKLFPSGKAVQLTFNSKSAQEAGK